MVLRDRGVDFYPAFCGADSVCREVFMHDTDYGDRLVDHEEAGRITGVKSRSWRYSLIAQGKFPKIVKIGSSTRFSERECYAFVAARKAERDGGK